MAASVRVVCRAASPAGCAGQAGATRRARRRADGSGRWPFRLSGLAQGGRLDLSSSLTAATREGAQRSDSAGFEVEPAPEHEMAPSPAEWTEGEGHGDPDGDFAPHDEPRQGARGIPAHRGSIRWTTFDVALTGRPRRIDGRRSLCRRHVGRRWRRCHQIPIRQRWSKAPSRGSCGRQVLDRPPGAGAGWRQTRSRAVRAGIAVKEQAYPIGGARHIRPAEGCGSGSTGSDRPRHRGTRMAGSGARGDAVRASLITPEGAERLALENHQAFRRYAVEARVLTESARSGVCGHGLRLVSLSRHPLSSRALSRRSEPRRRGG